jgi:hypothetical protein
MKVEASGAVPGLCLFVLSQVRDSMGPLKQWPAGHLIIAASRGPSLERMVNWHLTSAGSAHVTVRSSSRQAGQSRNIIVASSDHMARVRGWLTGPYRAGGTGHGLVSEFRSRRVCGQAAGRGQGRDAPAI